MSNMPISLYNGYVETYFSQENFLGNGPKLELEARHTPLRVGIAINVPDFEKEVCFVTNDDEN